MVSNRSPVRIRSSAPYQKSSGRLLQDLFGNVGLAFHEHSNIDRVPVLQAVFQAYCLRCHQVRSSKMRGMSVEEARRYHGKGEI